SDQPPFMEPCSCSYFLVPNSADEERIVAPKSTSGLDLNLRCKVSDRPQEAFSISWIRLNVVVRVNIRPMAVHFNFETIPAKQPRIPSSGPNGDDAAHRKLATLPKNAMAD